MKPPYREELAALDDTYARALASDVAPLRRAAHAIGQGPAVFVGSGGSMVLALLAARLHEWSYRQPSRACTSLELLDLPQIERRGAVLFSSSSKHPDAQRVLADFKHGRFDPTALVTHREAQDVRALANPDTLVITMPVLTQSDGFLATGSILQIATMLLRAYLDGPELPHDLSTNYAETSLRDEVLVLTPPSLASVAADIEVRLVESGLTSVQVADFRSFAHGRHTGYARRQQRTTVMVLSDTASERLADNTQAALPREADIRRWHCGASWETAVLTLLARSMRLVDSAANQANVDVARPHVPEFGRRLYHLSLAHNLPGRLAGGVERKLLAAGGIANKSTRKAYKEAADTWTEGLALQRFAGLVLDYDGTVCWTRQRWDLPDSNIRTKLTDLLKSGLIVGFASGRGSSLYSDLRQWVPNNLQSQVVVGLYNGAVQLRLIDDLPSLREPTEWSRVVTSALKGLPEQWILSIDERGEQVSIALSDGALPSNQLARTVSNWLDHVGVEAQVVSSAHSIDVIRRASTKSAVADTVEKLAGGDALAVGDQGQPGGNDHALLSRSDWTLSVDRCSANPSNCWFAGDGNYVGPSLLLKYLSAFRKRRNGFAILGIAAS